MAIYSLQDVIPSRLAWISQGARIPRQDVRNSYYRLRAEGIDSEAFAGGTFKVMHYDKRAVGSAFGPLSLTQIAAFCAELESSFRGNGAVLIEHRASAADRANMAVLIGSYLITREGWTVDRVSLALAEEAEIRFPCQWDRPNKNQEPVMSVRDCWEGMDLAKSLGWLRSFSGDPLGLSLSISMQRRLLAEYDATWLVPDKVLVMADPMTTIRDPNPTTCSAFVSESGGCSPEADEEASPSCLRTASAHKRQVTQETCATSSLCSDSEPGDVHLVPPCALGGWKQYVERIGSESTTHKNLVADDSTQALMAYRHGSREDNSSSVASICKRDNRDDATAASTSSKREIPDFMSFCHASRVAAIVRTNSGQEEGLVEDGGSYHPSAVRRHGIQHFDLFVNDTRGSLPRVEVVRQFVEYAQQVGMVKDGVPGISDKSPALLVHCKSGFGRSVLLACCLVIFAYDVPGRALLGWSRIARPGAITVREQEMFLCALAGRKDVQRLLDEARSVESPESGLLSCQPCCSVQ